MRRRGARSVASPAAIRPGYPTGARYRPGPSGEPIHNSRPSRRCAAADHHITLPKVKNRSGRTGSTPYHPDRLNRKKGINTLGYKKCVVVVGGDRAERVKPAMRRRRAHVACLGLGDEAGSISSQNRRTRLPQRRMLLLRQNDSIGGRGAGHEAMKEGKEWA